MASRDHLSCALRDRPPSKLEAFERFARAWMELVERHGGTHHGYFLPAEGASDIAYALFSFESLADYERYRGRFDVDPDFVEADGICDESGCVRRYRTSTASCVRCCPTGRRDESRRRHRRHRPRRHLPGAAAGARRARGRRAQPRRARAVLAGAGVARGRAGGVDRDAEDAAGTFGERIAALDADVVIDMICFTAESAQQLVDALRPRARCSCTAARSGSTAPPRASRHRGRAAHRVRRLRHRQGGDRGAAVPRDARRRRPERGPPSRATSAARAGR